MLKFSILFFAILLGLQIGYQIGVRHSYDVPPISFKADTRPLEPTVILDGVENGELHGRTHGSPRLFLQDHLILPDGSGAFRIPVGSALNNIIVINIPKGMHFVASKRGKKYYSVLQRAGESISPKNRIYFRTEREAISAGYKK